MQTAHARHEVVVNDEGEPIDYVYLEVNNAFEKFTGLKKEDVLGKRLTEAIPGIENDEANWIHKFGEVAITGKSMAIYIFLQH